MATEHFLKRIQETVKTQNPLNLELNLGNVELIIASRAIYSLVTARRLEGLSTFAEMPSDNRVASLIEKIAPFPDGVPCEVCPIRIELLNHSLPDGHLSRAFFKAFNLPWQGKQTGYFPEASSYSLSQWTQVRRSSPFKRYGNQVVLLPTIHPILDRGTEREGRFWDLMSQAILDAGHHLVIPKIETTTHAFTDRVLAIADLVECRSIWDVVRLLLGSMACIGKESWLTHLAAAYSIPSLTITANNSDHITLYEYGRMDFPVEYYYIHDNADWSFHDIYEKFSCLQSNFLSVP